MPSRFNTSITSKPAFGMVHHIYSSVFLVQAPLPAVHSRQAYSAVEAAPHHAEVCYPHWACGLNNRPQQLSLPILADQ